VRFRLKDQATINEDVGFAARYCRRQTKVFIGDGDALIIPTDRLMRIFSDIRKKLPWVNRISLYGNAKSILRKNREELLGLKQLGLDRIYMGLESGHDPTLIKIRKGVTSDQMINAAERVRNAGLFLSVTVLLGIGGIDSSTVHGVETGRILSAMKPNQIAALTLMLLDNTPLYHEAVAGLFQLPDRMQILLELKTMVQNIYLDRVQFQANHASNYLPISGRLARDKEKILDIIEEGLHGERDLRNESARAL